VAPSETLELTLRGVPAFGRRWDVEVHEGATRVAEAPGT
jgi:hypothetical protein